MPSFLCSVVIRDVASCMLWGTMLSGRKCGSSWNSLHRRKLLSFFGLFSSLLGRPCVLLALLRLTHRVHQSPFMELASSSYPGPWRRQIFSLPSAALSLGFCLSCSSGFMVWYISNCCSCLFPLLPHTSFPLSLTCEIYFSWICQKRQVSLFIGADVSQIAGGAILYCPVLCTFYLILASTLGWRDTEVLVISSQAMSPLCLLSSPLK